MLSKGTVLYTAFDEYRIIEQIGQGGNGTVFRAESYDGEFAVKIIDKNNTSNEKIKRFKNEINFCQKYRHKNVINVIDYGTYNSNNKDCMFYVMPYFKSNLRNEIKKGISPENVIPIFIQLLDGLEFIHKKGVWHRDIKPEHILFNIETQVAIIADLGIAHFYKEELITAVETKDMSRLANFVYAAPEQRIKGQIVDGRADIFALGLILNEMFTGKVINGSKYKTITDVSREYSFLDSLVEEMINQDQNQRMYPIEKIRYELSALIKLQADKSELQRLMEKKIEQNEVEDPLFIPPNIKDIDYKDGNLYIYLDKETNAKWDSILISGNYNYSSLLNYSPRSFISRKDKNGNTVFIVSVRYNEENNIEAIINNFKSWLPTVTRKYTEKIKAEVAAETRRRTLEHEEELKRKEAEMRIKQRLKNLI